MHKPIFEWAIVGAGPAGIAAVGKLIDSGIKPTAILWLDPDFNVGDLGRYWRNVSSNTKVKLFTQFLRSTASFDYDQAPFDFELNHIQPNETCLLQHIADPLQWVSDHLCNKVHAQKTRVQHLALSHNTWSLDTDSGHFQANNVVLATGAEPVYLDYPSIETIPFEIAIDKTRLAKVVNSQGTYAVFGSSHSAIIIIKELVELGVKKVINFYRSPCRYALDVGDSILFDNTGLKGQSAQWAREHIDGTLPQQVERYTSTQAHIEQCLPQCDKAIYAVGFKRRQSITIGDYEHQHYNPHVGIIGPGLFGLGIAYPQSKADAFGTVESQVGLWKFMVYLDKILPVWLQYHA